MSRPFESWSARARTLARPFAENPFRILELEPGTDARETARVAKELLERLRTRTDAPHMFAMGPATRNPEQVEAAAAELAEPVRAAMHALFVPWLKRLPVDASALPLALEELARRLAERADPIQLASGLARHLLPEASERAETESVRPGRLFAGDLDLAEAIGPPRIGRRAKKEKGFLDALGKAPSSVADALLAATRLGRGRKLHASYLRTLLAQVDAGDPAALRRWPEAKALFDQLEDEAGADLLLGWRDFIEGKLPSAKKRLASAAKSRQLTPRERARAQVLLARIALLRGEPAKWLVAIDAPEADWVRGAVALSEADVDAAREALDRAWSARELRPRLAPLLAQVLLAQDEPDAAARILDSEPNVSGRAAQFSRAWLAHARGELDPALDLYRGLAGHLGASWGVAVLSSDPDERSAARREVGRHADADARRELAELALEDGEVEEARRALGPAKKAAKPDALRVQVLDRLGDRAAAWKLRGEREEVVRDAARAMLEGGDPLGALRHLAGLPLTDPLRRRAAREAVLAAISASPESDPDEVAARVLGKVSDAELALLDLPAHLHRAIRELARGETRKAIASLRKHLDSGEDTAASRLFEVLTSEDPWPALRQFLATLLELDAPEAMALVDASAEAHDDLWEAAVVCAAVQGGAFEVGDFEGGSEVLRIAAALLELRAGLLAADNARCAEALTSVRDVLPARNAALDAAERALLAAQFSEAVERDPELALRALERSTDTSPAREHDLAVWRHFLAIGAEGALEPEQLAGVFEAWSRARDANALDHPELRGDVSRLEDELSAGLSALLGSIKPDRADAARAALEKLDDAFVREAMARAGWLPTAARRRDA